MVTEIDTTTREERLVPRVFRMNAEAWERWVAFTQWQADILNDETTVPKVRDWVGKVEGFGLRIALTLRMLADASDEVRPAHTVEALDIDRAATLVEYFYGMCLRVYGVAKNNVEVQRLHKLLHWMQKRLANENVATTFSDRECYSSSTNRTQYEGMGALRCALWKLKEHGYLREVPTEKKRADSATIWEINATAVTAVNCCS